MKFRKNQAIYLQIADLISANIITGEWPDGERIISVRELAGQIAVNPNTVMRAYALLQEEDILFNRRGVGFFVAEGAAHRIKQRKKKNFIKNDLKLFFEQMQLLDIDMKELQQLYQNFKSNK
jgi:Predicted transcriptional regulators